MSAQRSHRHLEEPILRGGRAQRRALRNDLADELPQPRELELREGFWLPRDLEGKPPAQVVHLVDRRPWLVVRDVLNVHPKGSAVVDAHWWERRREADAPEDCRREHVAGHQHQVVTCELCRRPGHRRSQGCECNGAVR